MDGKDALFKVKPGKRDLNSDRLKAESMENEGYGVLVDFRDFNLDRFERTGGWQESGSARM